MKNRTMLLFLSILNIVAFIATFTVNALANILPINGVGTGEVSDSLPNLFTPAGITFAIWGLIYLLLAVFVITLFVGVLRKTDIAEAVQRVGVFFIVASLANIVWIFAWHHYQIAYSLLLLLVLLASLLAIYLRLGVGKRSVSLSEKLAVHLPVSVYLGWVSVAVIANVTAFLVHIGLANLWPGAVFWTAVVIAVGGVLGIVALLLRGDIFYSLVILWAYAGIIIKRLGVMGRGSKEVIIAASAAGTVLLVGIILVIAMRRIYIGAEKNPELEPGDTQG
ncbi:MAG: hypothetical protein ACLFR1_09510 [Spirochaetia bacterium]